MNTAKKYELYKKFLSTKPICVIQSNWPGWNLHTIKMNYKINEKNLILNTCVDKETPFGYRANIMNEKRKIIAIFHNPFYAKELYEHGQKYL